MLIPWVPTSSITWCFLNAAIMMIYNQLFRGEGQKVVFLSFIKAVSLFNNHVPFISRLADHADLLHYMLVPHYLGTPPHPHPPMNCQFVWFEYAAKGWFIKPQYPLQLLLPCWGISPWTWILISVLSNNWIPIQIEGNWYRDDTRISDTVWTKQ